MQKKAPVVSQKGTWLTPNEKKSIIESFSSSIPLAERKFFVSMVESLSLQGLPPSGDSYFGYKLKCVDGRPFWDDVSAKRHGEKQFNHEGARTALENVALKHMETPLFKKSSVVDLNLMVVSHRSGKEKGAAFSIRYEFAGGKHHYSGALFVSGDSRNDDAVLKACNAFVKSNGDDRFEGERFISIVG